MLVNGLIDISDTSGLMRTVTSYFLGDLLVGGVGVFLNKGERVFVTLLSPSKLCISSYSYLSANSRIDSFSSFLLCRKACRYPFHASVTQIPMMVVTSRNQAF